MTFSDDFVNRGKEPRRPKNILQAESASYIVLGYNVSHAPRPNPYERSHVLRIQSMAQNENENGIANIQDNS